MKVLNWQESAIETFHVRLYSTSNTTALKNQYSSSWEGSQLQSSQERTASALGILPVGQSQNWSIDQHETTELLMSEGRTEHPKSSPESVDWEQLDRFTLLIFVSC